MDKLVDLAFTIKDKITDQEYLELMDAIKEVHQEKEPEEQPTEPVKVDIEEDPRWKTLDERLPVPPFLIVLQAPVASGKTTTFVNLLYDDNFYREMFDSVVIFSPTIHNDLTWKVALDDDTVTIYSGEELENIDDTMEHLYKIQLDRVREAEEAGNSPPHMLMIIDDCLGLLGKKFNRLVTRHRHPRLSIMVSTQNFRALNLQVRQNSSHYMIYRTNNNKELE